MRNSTPESIGLMMKGMEVNPIKVGANLLMPASWSTFGSSLAFFPNEIVFFGLVFLDSSSSSSDPLMSLLEVLTKNPMMFPGMMTEAKHCQMRQSRKVVKTSGVN